VNDCWYFRCVRYIEKRDHNLPHIRPSAWNNSAPTGGVFMKFDTWGFVTNLSRKFKFDWNCHEGLRTFMFSRWILIKRQNVPDKNCRKTEKIHLMIDIFFLRKLCLLWVNVEISGRPRLGTDEDIIRRRKDAICMPNN